MCDHRQNRLFVPFWTEFSRMDMPGTWLGVSLLVELRRRENYCLIEETKRVVIFSSKCRDKPFTIYRPSIDMDSKLISRHYDNTSLFKSNTFFYQRKLISQDERICTCKCLIIIIVTERSASNKIISTSGTCEATRLPLSRASNQLENRQDVWPIENFVQPLIKVKAISVRERS